jgi:S1-C subfamily serine protease
MTGYPINSSKVLLIAAILVSSTVVVLIAFWSYDTYATIQTSPTKGTNLISVQDNNNYSSSVPTAGASPALAQVADNINNISSGDLSLPDLFEKTQPSVVQITDSSDNEPTTLGSGYIYDSQGHVVTNYHVVSSGGSTARLDVTFSDGTIYRAKLVGFDAGSDLAVLSIDNVPKQKLVTLVLANSSSIKVGEQVAAIGNPFGLSGSMSEGIVSGLSRLIPADQGSQNNSGNSLGYSIPDVIQTDAPINPGNSGGPLLSINGQVIGINTAIFSTTGQYSGVGFAIPSNTIARVVPALISTGSYKHPWLGISGTDVTPDIADSLKLKEPRGFLVADVVDGSPAQKAGIHGGSGDTTTINGRQVPLGGDVILGIDGKPVRKIDDILVYLEGSKNVGDKIRLSVIRNGGMMDIQVVLGARPSLSESP